MNISKQKKDILNFKDAFSIHFFSVAVGIFLSIFLAAGTKFDLTVPTGFYDDRTALFMIIKSMLNGTFVSVDQISYPDTFSYLYFPVSDFTQRALIYLLSRLSQDVIVISNLYNFSHIALSFMASYAAAYSYSGRRALSCLAALLFIFTPYLVVRSVDHDFLAAFYSVPVTFFMVMAIHRHHSVIMDRDLGVFLTRPLHVTSFAIIALSGVYYTVFSIALLLYAGLILSYLRASSTYLRLAFMSVMAIVTMLVIAVTPMALYHITHQVLIPSRHYMEQTLYGIRIADLLWTAQHYFSVSGFNSYFESRGNFEGFDFWPGLGLSVIGLGLIFFAPLIVMTRLREGEALHASRQNSEFIAVQVTFIIIILLTAHVYGFGLIINMVFNSIRSQNRISPYFTFALILILLSETERLIGILKSENKNPRFIMAGIHTAGVALFLLNAYPFLGFMTQNQKKLASQQDYQSDHASLKATLDALHRTDAQHVLQLPIAPWPEHPMIEKFQPYHHLLFYVFDKPQSSIRWSYGQVRESTILKHLQSIQTDPDRISQLKTFACFGYDTLLIEKRGLNSTDNRLIAEASQTLGLQPLFEDPLRSVMSLPQASPDFCAARDISMISS